MIYTGNFNKLPKKDLLLKTGGKGASLSKMSQVGIPVPEGFVIFTQAFDEFLKVNELDIKIKQQLSAVDVDSIQSLNNISFNIQNEIKISKIPKEIVDDILQALDDLGEELVAVRSSATSEDSLDASWAGQLDSYMNITRDDVVHTVKKCWASLFTPRAILYRIEKKLQERYVSVAVVIQNMIQSVVSGVAFSVNPITKDYNQIIIEAGWGFGDAIVSGMITPDSYIVEKESNNIADVNVSKQEKELTRRQENQEKDLEWGENIWTRVSVDKQKKQKLTKEQILELAELIQNIEKYYGFPVDVEWTFESDTLYITQSRPITTL